MSFEPQKHLQTKYKDDSIGDTYFYARVIDNNDPLDSYRVKVRIKGIDDKYQDADLPWCETLSPIFLSIIPQQDEMVKVFLQNQKFPLMRRQWIGPIVSSVQTLPHESYLTALSNTATSTQTPNKAISKIPSAKGAYPDKKDIAIQGRDNTDIVFKEKEILIRAGKFVFNDNTTLNTKNPAYIRLNYLKDGSTTYGGLVADNIFLISHKGSKTFKSIIDDNELLKIFSQASPAVLGDYLYNLLSIMVINQLTHVHPPELPQNPGSPKYKELAEFNLKSILSQSIRIN